MSLNLFIIPSWYPNPVESLSGIFTQEQAEAIADLCPEIKVIVSTWGHNSRGLQVKKPVQSIRNLVNHLRQNSNSSIALKNGVWEVYSSSLSWSHKLPMGGATSLLSANRKNLALAQQKFGQIDILHAHISFPAGFIASVLSREFNIPYIITEHMGPFPFRSLMRKGEPLPEIPHAFKHASQTIAVSTSLQKRILSFGYKEPKCIPNLVDERRFTIGRPQNGKFIFLTLCSLNDQKGIDHLLKAIAHWDPPQGKFEFRIGGAGSKRSRYEALAEQLGISDRIRWLGKITREEAPKCFQNCHAYVMPSRHETFGIVYAEAIASGKPIIATKCGGPESIVNKINGRLVPIGDIEGLADSMQWMANHWSQFNPSLIREDFENRFSRPAVVSQLRELYQSVVK